jgi:hypothetical protein
LHQRDSALTERRYRRKSLYQARWIAELWNFFSNPHLRDSLSLVNDQAIPVGITKGRPMADLRFSRSEEEGDIVFAQVSDSAFEVVDFKCN